MEDSENSGANTRKMGVKGHNPNGEAKLKRGKKGGTGQGDKLKTTQKPNNLY